MLPITGANIVPKKEFSDAFTIKTDISSLQKSKN